MNNETMELLERHFDTAFAAPDGIKKLRELILTLAMQGKLVPQDSHELPASELLKEIEAEKLRLVKECKIKKPKPLPSIKLEDVPYELPTGWAWVRLATLADIQTGKKDVNQGHENGFYPFFSCAAEPLKSNEYSFDCEALLLPGNGANVGLVTLFNGKFEAYQRTYVVNNFLNCSAQYIEQVVKARFLKTLEGKQFGSAINYIKLGNLTEFLIPLPPLPEQHRIVAKIDQLMARCDELEKLRAEQEQNRLAVHTAALKQLLDAQEQDSFTNAWQFIIRHFGELYTVKENVIELRKTILQLAVMGKLVPQDPNDPPASELLQEIEAEKQRLVKAGKIKQPKPLPSIKQEEVPHELPKGWGWVRLGEISLGSDSGWSPQCLSGARSGDNWGVLKVSAVSWGAYNPSEHKALPGDKKPRPECEVKSGDFLISRANTDDLVARSVIVHETPPHLMMSDKIVRISLSERVNKTFINIVNGSTLARAYYISNASGTSSSMKNVSRVVMTQLPLPLPPHPEQHRIVVKIDQLMALCDTLEQQIDTATTKQTELLGAIMARVLP